MKPLQVIKSNATTSFWGTRFVYISKTRMVNESELNKNVPIIWALHILNFAFGFVILEKIKKD